MVSECMGVLGRADWMNAHKYGTYCMEAIQYTSTDFNSPVQVLKRNDQMLNIIIMVLALYPQVCIYVLSVASKCSDSMTLKAWFVTSDIQVHDNDVTFDLHEVLTQSYCNLRLLVHD